MLSPMMTLRGLETISPEIWTDFTVPEVLNRELLIDTIRLKAFELEILFANADYMRGAIGVWSKSRAPIWVKLYETTQYEYDPIANYDRHEEYADTESGTSEASSTRTDSAESSSTDSAIAFNADAFRDRTRTEELAESEGSTSGSDNYSRSFKHKAHLYGNIGVTTTQEMIESERRVVQFNLYEQIAEEFVNKFCLLVY